MAFLWDISHAVHERRLIPGFLTAAFYNFLLLSFQTKANIKRKILELLSACGKMKKHNNSQGCGRTVSELNTVLCLTSTYQSWSAIRSPVGYPQKCIRNNIPTVAVFTVTSFTSGSLLQMSSSHQCRVLTAVNKIPVPATGMSHPRHAQTSSIRKPKHGQHWPKQLLSLVANKGQRQSQDSGGRGRSQLNVLLTLILLRRPWSRQHPTISTWRCLQGFAFWVTGGQIWLGLSHLKFLSNTETSLNENNISSLSKPAPLS